MVLWFALNIDINIKNQVYTMQTIMWNSIYNTCLHLKFRMEPEIIHPPA